MPTRPARHTTMTTPIDDIERSDRKVYLYRAGTVAGPGSSGRAMPFEMKVRQYPGPTVVCVSGELDLEAAPDLCALFDALAEDQQVNMLVDLEKLSFCDSVGLSALIHGYNVCHGAGGAFRITGDTGLVARVLRATGLRTLLTEPEPG
jgi:anti-anti-sigma factor